ncbi:ABC transporter ATP-binding protein [Clostridium sp. PL3]|uniref:ABC transporter ATP-binding protein n=1 Tax=Clostridium thailandense TaxID=2794346 RepID=A0A949TY99_9CLOT|nr:ABC transporter ATP-binding protein [Clostridium thailandense]MBV7273805.1 ABC transporter ATP-binding protein [Clostridium thailandense]
MIKIDSITKRYGNHTAIKNINLEIKKGEILGLLGPNGAGKSTTMNIITGYISATDGSVLVDGFDIFKNPIQAKKRIGYLPEIPPLYTDMTVEEYLNFVSRLKKVNKNERKEHIDTILESIKLTDVRKRLIKNLSKGYKQRVGLAQAIVGDPEILILDEPTVGLDPKQIIEIRDLISKLGKEHTIILSSHILSEISAICDRVVIINKGSIVAEGTPDELSHKLSYGTKIALRIKSSLNEAEEIIKGVSNINSVSNEGVKEPDTIDLIVEGKNDCDIREALFYAFSRANIPLLMIKPLNLTLEEIFLEVTNESKEESLNAGNVQ